MHGKGRRETISILYIWIDQRNQHDILSSRRPVPSNGQMRRCRSFFTTITRKTPRIAFLVGRICVPQSLLTIARHGENSRNLLLDAIFYSSQARLVRKAQAIPLILKALLPSDYAVLSESSALTIKGTPLNTPSVANWPDTFTQRIHQGLCSFLLSM